MKKIIALMMVMSFALLPCSMADASPKYKRVKKSVIAKVLNRASGAASAGATLRQGGTKLEAADAALGSMRTDYSIISSGVKMMDPKYETLKGFLKQTQVLPK